MPLDELTINNAKSREKRFSLSDERGLFLHVNPSGSKLWQIKYQFACKARQVSLGPYPEVTLEMAREKRDLALLQIREGRNPSHEIKATSLWQLLEARNSFKAVALDFIKEKGSRWSERQRTNAIRWLESHIFPALGNRPIGQIEPPELFEALRKIEASGLHATADRVRMLCGQVFRYAASHGMCSGRIGRARRRRSG